MSSLYRSESRDPDSPIGNSGQYWKTGETRPKYFTLNHKKQQQQKSLSELVSKEYLLLFAAY